VRPPLGEVDEKLTFTCCCFTPFVVRTQATVLTWQAKKQSRGNRYSFSQQQSAWPALHLLPVHHHYTAQIEKYNQLSNKKNSDIL